MGITCKDLSLAKCTGFIRFGSIGFFDSESTGSIVKSGSYESSLLWYHTFFALHCGIHILFCIDTQDLLGFCG